MTDATLSTLTDKHQKAPDLSFADLVFHANDVIVVTDAATRRISYVNPAFTRLTGYSEAEALGRSPGALLQGPGTNPQSVALIRDALAHQVPVRTELLNYAKSGREYWLDINLVPLFGADGRASHFAAIERDITDAKLLQQRLVELASLDPLTGLANRRTFAAALAREVSHARRESTPLGLVVFDIDHFKRINDSYGHAAGDTVLETVGPLCQPLLRPRDLLARIGGEEFALLLPGANLAVAAAVAERMRSALADQPITAGDAAIEVSASFGVATLTALDGSGAPLLKRADQCMYAAKAGGRNRACLETW